MTEIYHQLSDVTYSPLSITFPLQDFIDSLWYHLGKPPNGKDFWEEVVRDASKGQTDLPQFQRKYLKDWVVDNKFHITQNFSKRAKATLTLRLELL